LEIDRWRKYTSYLTKVYSIAVTSMSAAGTVKVSRKTLLELEKLRKELNAKSLDHAIRALLKRYRVRALREALGSDKGRIRPFTEDDRGEDR